MLELSLAEPADGEVALVLGAGGPVGHAYHAGVLRALAEGCGFDAGRAALIVGTSAGAHVGALLRAGLDPGDLQARVRGAPLSAGGDRLSRALPPPHAPPYVTMRRLRWPASSAYLWHTARRPWRARPGRLAAALLPEGAGDNATLGEGYRRLFAGGWPARPLWITALHLHTGERVVFGQAGAPEVDVGTAVRCSSAVPGMRAPVQVAGEPYIDGGFASGTHVELVAQARRPPRVIVVSSPLSRFFAMRLLLRAELRRLRRLRRRGARVVLFEPCAEVRAAMGWNPMDAAIAPRVAEIAFRATLRRLRREAAGLAQLLAGR